MELYTKLLSTIYILKEKVFKFRMHHPYIFELYHTSLRESSFVVDLCYFSPIILEALQCFIYNQQKLKFSTSQEVGYVYRGEVDRTPPEDTYLVWGVWLFFFNIFTHMGSTHVTPPLYKWKNSNSKSEI